jgi:hypothetical protein
MRVKDTVFRSWLKKGKNSNASQLFQNMTFFSNLIPYINSNDESILSSNNKSYCILDESSVTSVLFQ